MRKKDPRRKDFFDTPGNTDNELSDASEMPRRKQKKRDSLGGADISAKIATDGFTYRKKRKRRPTSIKKSQKEKENSCKAPSEHKESDSEKEKDKDSFVVKETIEKLDPLPEYPDTSEGWSPLIDWEKDTPGEVALLKLVKQVVAHELRHARSVYEDKHAFAVDRLDNICAAFLSDLHSCVIEKMSQAGTFIPPQPRPNPRNDILAEQELVWKATIQRLQKESDDWDTISDRPIIVASDSDCKERSMRALKQYSLEHDALQLIQRPISAYTKDINNKAERTALLTSDSAKRARKLLDAVKSACDKQARITQKVSKLSLEPFQQLSAKDVISSMLKQSL